MEWIIGNRMPFIPNKTFQVQFENNDICIVKFDKMQNLIYEDCLSPCQNALCDTTRIKAWRLNEH